MLKCPNCEADNMYGAKQCSNCGHDFQSKQKISMTSHDDNYCKKCGMQLEGVNFCPTCGTKVMSSMAKPKSKKQSKNLNKTAKACVLGISIPFIIIGLLLLPVLFTSDETYDETTNNMQNSDKVVALIMDECEVSEETAQKIKKDFEDVGIDDLEKLSMFDGAQVEGLKSFEYSSKKVSGTLIVKNGATDYIDTGDIILFDDEKGGAIDNISRYYLSNDEKSLYLYSAEELVKQNLKAPSTADFPNWYGGEWHISRKDNVITIVSYVDSQNSFGAMIREKFAIQYSYTTQTCTYFEFGGEVVYGTAKK